LRDPRMCHIFQQVSSRKIFSHPSRASRRVAFPRAFARRSAAGAEPGFFEGWFFEGGPRGRAS
jgi:hypothetical protein